MPRWWTKPWHIALLPGALVLRGGGEERRIACDPASGWRAPLAALDAALKDAPARARSASLSVADSFARHAVVPWADGLAASAARDAYVRLRMEAACGASLDGWTVRHDLRHWRRPALAIALPDALLAGLEECCARQRVALQGLQTRMSVLLARRRLPPDVLLLLPEGDRCLLASRVAGAWHHVRMARGSDVAMLSARERCLAGLPAGLPLQLLEDAT